MEGINLYHFAPPSALSTHQQAYDKIGEHHAKVEPDAQAGEHAQHCTQTDTYIDYANVGTDSPDSASKT